LDDHVLRGSKKQACRREVPRLIEILHDVGHVLGLELDATTTKIPLTCQRDLSHANNNHNIMLTGDCNVMVWWPRGMWRSEPRRRRRGRRWPPTWGGGPRSRTSGARPRTSAKTSWIARAADLTRTGRSRAKGRRGRSSRRRALDRAPPPNCLWGDWRRASTSSSMHGTGG
jgi:hypothetical protein